MGKRTCVGRNCTSKDVEPFEVPPGVEHVWEVDWTTPGAEGSYSLLLELWHGGERQIVGRHILSVVAGRITALGVPERLQPGQEAAFQVAFANLRGESYDRLVHLSIHSADGTLVAMLKAPLSAAAQSEGTAKMLLCIAGTGGQVAGGS